MDWIQKTAMLPPVDDGVLKNNPEFAHLYSTLTTTVLNPDGSTKSDAAAKERLAVREALDKHRLETAKQNLIIHALSALAPKTTAPTRTTPARDLPEPLIDLLLLLPPFLSSTPEALSPEATALLLSSPPFCDIETYLPQLASLVSASLHASAVHVARVAQPATNPSYVHRAVPQIPARAAALEAAIDETADALTRARLEASGALATLLREETEVLEKLLRALEAKHGPIARSLEFRATEAGLEAARQRAEAELAVLAARKEVYTPEAVRALNNYSNHLRDAKARLGEAVAALRAELEAYGVGGEEGQKERVMRELARVYGEMKRQMEDVRADLDRLGRA